ncbi:MAG: ABC transporter ATP-binding protein [Rhabdochlamydiaceae bacterium]|jgi:oligopeptide/dipeptide ABC transporter ATP-binding protein
MHPLITVKNLTKHFPYKKKALLQAVNHVSLEIHTGETLGLVGESGSGKSTLGKLLLRLHEPTTGSVTFSSKNIFEFPPAELKAWRQTAQMIFQDPYASLNPRMTAEAIISEPFHIHNLPITETRLEQLFSQVGLNPEYRSRFPHEFSAGQRQRIAIARALALNPKFLVCDEAISSLDVSVQAQIINLLKDLQKNLGLTYLFISHDLRMVKYISHRIAVMYLGHIVEIAPASELYQNPLHPYTQALLSAIPVPDPAIEKTRTRIMLQGEIPRPLTPPKGCKFCTRCPQVHDLCHQVNPPLQEISTGHFVACHLYRGSS